MTARPTSARGRRVRQRPEEALHMAVARFLDVALPAEATWFHVPNGGSRNVVEAAKLKAMGTKAGVADCIVVYRGRALAIELKPAKSGALSINQRLWRQRFIHAGGSYFVARSLEQIQSALEVWGVPMKAKLTNAWSPTHLAGWQTA